MQNSPEGSEINNVPPREGLNPANIEIPVDMDYRTGAYFGSIIDRYISADQREGNYEVLQETKAIAEELKAKLPALQEAKVKGKLPEKVTIGLTQKQIDFLLNKTPDFPQDHPITTGLVVPGAEIAHGEMTTTLRKSVEASQRKSGKMQVTTGDTPSGVENGVQNRMSVIKNALKNFIKPTR